MVNKFLIAVGVAVLVFVQSFLNSPAGQDGIDWTEWVQFAVVAFAAADVWLTANVPGARAAKAIVLGGAAILAALVAHAATGGDIQSVHWWNTIITGVGAAVVYLVPNAVPPALASPQKSPG